MAGANDLTAKIRIDGDAAGAVKATESVDKSLRDLDQTGKKVDLSAGADKATAGLTRTASSADRLNAAFATLNIRSAGKIQADINAVNQSLVALASNAKVSGADFDRAYAGAQVRLAALRAELAGTEAAAGKTSTTVAGLGASLKGLAAPIAGAAIAQEFIRANVAAESLERTLVQLTGSGEAAAAEVDYLKTTANRLGLSVMDASRAYISLTAAAKGTSLEGAGTRQIFEAVAGAMSKLGKSSADTEGALQAVSQMIGKGTVSMEEMRQQLAERLPGAMQATADAVGVTVGELTEMISSGQVLASDLLPKMAEGLQKMYGTAGQAEGSVATWNRLKNAIAETYTFIGNSGVWLALVTILEGTSKIVSGLTAGFDFLGRTGGNTAAFLTEVWKNPSAALARYREEQARAHEETIGALRKSLAASAAAAATQQKLATTTQAAGAAAQQSSISWLAVVNAYSKVGTAAKEGVEAAVKSAAARAEEGKTAVALAQAFGAETEKRTAALDAAKNDADALRAVADARRIEAEVARSNLVALQESTKAEGALTEEKRKQIAAVEQSATVKAAEAQQAAAASLAAQQRAAALATETAMIADNSTRIGELRAAHEAAAVALANTSAARAAGVATMAQEQTAAIAAGQAAALYRDALNDQTRAIEYNAAIKAKEADLKGAGLKLDIAHLQTMAQVAKAYGDEGAAASYLLEIKRLEIQLAELTAQAKRAEAQAALQAINAKRAELQASGELTAAKQAELQAQELGAQVKLKEAEIATEVADRMRQLADATADYAGVTGGAADGTNVLAGSLNAGADSADRMTQSMLRLQQVQQGGGGGGDAPPSDGVRNVTASPSGQIAPRKVDFTETLYRRGASIEEQKLAQKYVNEYFARNQATMMTGNLGNEDNANRLQRLAVNDAVDKAIAAARKELQTGQAVDLGTSVNDLIARNNAKTPLKSMEDMIGRIKNAGNEAKNQSIRVDLRTDRGRSAVNVASPQDASALISTLKDLQGRAV